MNKEVSCAGLAGARIAQGQKMGRLVRLTACAVLWLMFGLSMPAFAKLGMDWEAVSRFSPRMGHVSLSFDGKIWVIGGLAHGSALPMNDVWYSVDGIEWQLATRAAEFAGRFDHAAVAFKGRMWVIGGWSFDHQSSTFKSDVWSSKDGTHWTLIADDAPFGPCYWHQCLVYNDKIWLIGGMNHEGSTIGVWCSEDGEHWTQVTAEPAFGNLSRHRAVVFDGKMWVIGGQPIASSWWSTDGINWNQAVGNVPSRMDQTCAVHDGRIWIIGGMNAETAFRDVWNSEDGANWVQVNASPPFRRMTNGAVVSHHNRLVVIGGYVVPDPEDGDDFSPYCNEVWSSPDGLTWTNLRPDRLFSNNGGQKSVVFRDKIWLIGGIHNSNVIWSSVDGTSWTLDSTPAAFDNRTDHGLVVFKDKIWLIGGDQFPPEGGVGVAKSDVWYSDNGTSWTQAVADAPFGPRFSPVVLVFKDRIWLIGGKAPYIDGRPVDVWSSEDGIHWSQATACAFRDHNRLSAVAFNDRIWAIGGWMDHPDDCVWSSADGDHWTSTVVNNPPVVRRYCHDSIVLDDRIWVIGGSNIDPATWEAIPYFNDVWWSRDGVNWKQAKTDDKLVPRAGHNLVSFHDKLWMLGGYNYDENLLEVWFSDLDIKESHEVPPGDSEPKAYGTTGATLDFDDNSTTTQVYVTNYDQTPENLKGAAPTYWSLTGPDEGTFSARLSFDCTPQGLGLEDLGGFQPQLYHSLDNGATWTEVDAVFDEDTQSLTTRNLQQHFSLWSVRLGTPNGACLWPLYQ